MTEDLQLPFGQPVLRDEAPPASPTPERSAGTIDEQFDAFVEANPWIIDEVADRCRRLRARGFERYGIGAIVEAIRFDRSLAMGDDESGFRVNNSVRSRLARRVMADHTDLDGFFELRRLRSDEAA